jgi:hypothetical protein
MRWTWLLLGGILAGALAGGSPGQAGPFDGGLGTYQKLDGRSKVRLEPIVFKGNERACVIFVGDHEPVVELAIKVYDENNKLVAQDDPGGDFCAAIWYPPRDAAYTIEVENRGDEWNKCWIAIK